MTSNNSERELPETRQKYQHYPDLELDQDLGSRISVLEILVISSLCRRSNDMVSYRLLRGCKGRNWGSFLCTLADHIHS